MGLLGPIRRRTRTTVTQEGDPSGSSAPTDQPEGARRVLRSLSSTVIGPGGRAERAT